MFLNKDHSCRTSFLYHLVEELIVKLKAPLISRSWNLLSTCVSRPVLWGWMTYNEQTFVGRAFAHLYCSHLGPDQQVCAVQIIIQTMFLFIYFFFWRGEGKDFSFTLRHSTFAGICFTAPPSALLGHLALSLSSLPHGWCWRLQVLWDQRGPEGGETGIHLLEKATMWSK